MSKLGKKLIVAAKGRDFDKQPYDRSEKRVAAFFGELGIGGGDDPVGALLASHRHLAREARVLRESIKIINDAVELMSYPQSGPG